METQDNIFSNEDITVTFEPCKCIHAEKCAKELSEVFRTSVIPWINLDGIETKRIIKQIKKCPSGALQYSTNNKRKVS
ncbi:(4Fe-4S)-binding protein [Pontimicrobium aquaticum]|uniref:(4Fe-4S)-binding protein n=1 Tax=Pontimicrobium aquaticum TaxID=2565367 RepID=A0A4U0EWJ9_9FLAO|nr:(4Fe-4S)-binding protein [Pontimicrobium aquaticum]TJY36361.1 (4Fe-4S)-binding protein [Pontimicrobium aquaticum]